ncbi:MAG: hypothetical protein H6651_06645 [Ardenticatenales bacterium]|nr:hypothetical protein [Ardenticatenales bacterium]
MTPYFRSIETVPAAAWQAALGLADDEIPDAVIVEGSWWRAERQAWRLSYLTEVRELGFPDLFWGKWGDKKVVFALAYGAARAGEVIYLFSRLGARLAIQLGTCGGLQSQLRPGDIILPEQALAQDGVAQFYSQSELVPADPIWLAHAETALRERNLTVHRGPHVTFASLFAETPAMMHAWHEAGYLGVDMETATTLAVARQHGVPALALLAVWDDLSRGRSFLDPLAEDELAALNQANEAVYEVALGLVGRL